MRMYPLLHPHPLCDDSDMMILLPKSEAAAHLIVAQLYLLDISVQSTHITDIYSSSEAHSERQA